MKTEENKEKTHLPELLTILGIFFAMWIGSIKIIDSLIHKQIVVFSFSNIALPGIILLISYILFSFLFVIILSVYYETSFSGWKEVSVAKLTEKKKQCYTEVMSGWAIRLFTIVPTVLILAYQRIFGLWGYLLGIILTAILVYGLFFAYVNPLLKKKYIVTNRIRFMNLFFKNISGEQKKIFGEIVRNLISMIVYMITVIAMTSGVDISLDKQIYASNENVIVHINPYGIIPPKINYIYYSNYMYLIYNGTNEPYGSFRIAKIPSNLLTEKAYNSYITVIASLIPINEKISLSEAYISPVPVYERLQGNDLLNGSDAVQTNSKINISLNSTPTPNSKGILVNQNNNSNHSEQMPSNLTTSRFA